jgi:PAS domain S-box-containing protein
VKKGIKILMVEDHAFDAELIQRELVKSKLNFTAKVVETKKSFEKALTEFIPDIILSDHSLPGFDSREALAIFHERNLQIPFILVTGTVSEEFAVESLKSGADDYILKSALKRLPSAITNALHKKRVERESSEMFSRYKMILEMMPAGCVINDANFKFLYWNAEAEKMFGYKNHEVLGKHPSETITPSQSQADLNKKFQEIKEGKAFETGINENVTKNGDTIVCEWRNSRLTDGHGKFIGILSICVNVTEKVAAERELIKFASLVESSTEFIGVTDMKGQLNYLNKSGCLLVGLDKSKVNQKQIQHFFSEADFERVYEDILPEILLDGKWEGEFRFKHFTSGKSIPIYLYGFLIKDPDSRPVAVAFVAHDITRQKESEQKLKRSEEKLQYTLEELNTFIYKASHDLKGPLSSIIGLLTLVKDLGVEGPELFKYLDMIESSTRKLDSVLSGLIETMRVKDIERSAEKIDFNTIINNVLKGIEYSQNFDKVKFNLDVKVNKDFFSHSIIIHSILQNLIENAIKYHHYDQPSPQIFIRVKEQKDGVSITIKDNGPGMRKEVLEKIFEMYYRGNESSKGSGLGLYIVKTAVKRLEGEIEVTSEEGNGTMFTIYLPSLEHQNQ